MSRIDLKSRIAKIACGMILCLCALAACGNPAGSTGKVGTPTPIQQEVSTNPTIAPSPTATHSHSTPVVTSHATPASTAGSGPLVILTPTPLPGGSSRSQLVTLPDRTLAIQNASKQQGMDAHTTAVTLVMSVKNTGSKSIPNQASYYLLVGSEGDIFGYQSSATPSYFGTIAPSNARSGSIVFQVPTAAVNGLRLLFRPDITQETVFVALQVS
jgi:hypothetical protein